MSVFKEYEFSRLATLSDLDEGKSQTDRNKLGQFATPPSLALDVVKYAHSLLTDDCKIRFLEPGFGTGSFYSAFCRLVDAKQIEAAAGYEIDPYYGRPSAKLWGGTDLLLKVEDFTKAEPPIDQSNKFNLVVCNPPYVRHHHLSHVQKADLREHIFRHFGVEMNGLSGLYTYFMILSKLWMVDGGIGAWLIPSEFMDVNYGRKLKEFLLQFVSLLRVHRFDPTEVQFDDAMVSSAVVVFRNSTPQENRCIEFSFGGTVNQPTRISQFCAKELLTIRKWSHLDGQPTSRMKAADNSTLSTLFSVKRGLATGDNKFFVLDCDLIAQFDIPHQFLVPILPSPRFLESDEIEADENGDPRIDRKRYLLTCDLSEDVVRKNFPSLWKYYQYGVSIGVKDRYLCRHRRPWYTQEQRPATQLLCSYMGRSTSNKVSPFRFIRNHSKATAANVYLMLYPRHRLQRIFEAYPEAIERIWRELQAITTDSLTHEGRVYGGGLHKMEPSELGNVSAERVLKVLEQFEFSKPEFQHELFAVG